MLTDNIQNLIGNTPLIKLRDSNIYAKLECFNPLGSVKDRAALNMILEAEKAGILKRVVISLSQQVAIQELL